MRKMLLPILILLPFAASAQDGAVGRWKTIDDVTGKPKSVVECHRRRKTDPPAPM